MTLIVRGWSKTKTTDFPTATCHKMSDSDDEVPRLPTDTLAILNSFMQEQNEKDKKLNEAIQTGDTGNVSISEDWQLSQFWYTEETAQRLAEEAINVAGKNGRIACVSSPTAYKKICEIKPDSVVAKCLEFDDRFKIYGEDFQFYDYKEPLNLPLEWKQSFDIVVVDPPFLAEECLCKTAVTVKFLAKEKIVLCTGAVMEDFARKLLDVRPVKFIPQHTNQLQNEFRCYINYDSALLDKS